MTQYWSVRLGEKGKYIEDAKNGKYIAIGWNELGRLEEITDRSISDEEALEKLKDKYKTVPKYKSESEIKVGLSCSGILKFIRKIQKDDIVLSPYTKQSKVLIAKVSNIYDYKEKWGDNCPYSRRIDVEWKGDVNMDKISPELKGSVSQQQTVTSLDKHYQEIETILRNLLPRHEKVKEMIVELGKIFNKIPIEEYKMSSYKYDVIWKNVESGYPTYAFQIQDKGNLDNALMSLKGISDQGCGRLFLIVFEDSDYKKAKKVLESAFHKTTLMKIEEFEGFYKCTMKYAEIMRKMR